MKQTLRQSRAEYLALKSRREAPPAASDGTPGDAPSEDISRESVAREVEARLAERERRAAAAASSTASASRPTPSGDASGEKVAGDDEAGFEIPAPYRDPTPAELIARIRKRRPPPTRAEKLRLVWTRHSLLEIFRHKKRIAFYRQFHKLVRSGTSLSVGLTELARHAPSRAMRDSIGAIALQIRKGDSLGDALRSQSGEFDDVNVEIIALGEETGSLQAILERIVEHMDRMQKLRWQILQSSLYPMYLMGAVTFVGPLMGLGAEVSAGTPVAGLPGVYLGGLARNLLLLVGLMLLIFSWPFLTTLLGAESRWDRAKLKVPGVGRAFRSIYASRFYLTLGLAISSGLEIVKAVSLAMRSSGSPYLASRIPAVEAKLRAGGELTDVIHSLATFDATDIGTIAVGERTGTLDEAFEELAEDHREGAIRGIRFLSLAVLGGLGLVFMGIAIKMLLGALFGPILNYFNTIRDLVEN